jgi:hypothetical protein
MLLPDFLISYNAQAVAQALQASAHFLQCSLCSAWLPHSVAQALQISTHSLHKASA